MPWNLVCDPGFHGVLQNNTHQVVNKMLIYLFYVILCYIYLFIIIIILNIT